MRRVLLWAAPLLALASSSCGSHGSSVLTPELAQSPTVPTSSLASAGLGSPSISPDGDLATSALALYTLAVDPATLQASITLKETRSAQANDDLYALAIDSFLRADSIRVKGLTATATTIDLSFVVAHPFPAPSNPTGAPNGSTNRADLGIAGMIMLLADVPSATGNTFFTDRVANTTLVANADAYFAPGQLLSVTGNANTFPYKELVDEVIGGKGSRVGISNNGDVTGNFGSDGWTRAEFGATNDGWTGYGVLHQGQSSLQTMSLNKAALATGLTLDLAIVAKYNDPRGGATPAAKKANRLPPAAADASLFAYRMPHGSLDVGRLEVLPSSGTFLPNAISASTLNFRVDDWDARSTETSAADLSADAAFDTVAVGESGVASLDVCIPGVLGAATFSAPLTTVIDDDTAFGGDAGADSGRPGDGLVYSETISKLAGSGQIAGDYTGFIRATDVESGLVIGLDETLTPLATPPDLATYQAFTVTMGNPCVAPSAGIISPSGSIGCSGGSATFGIAYTGDPAVSYSWNFGGGAVPNVSASAAPVVTLGAANTYNGSVTVDNGCGTPVNFPFAFTVTGAYNEYLVDDTPITGNGGYWQRVVIHNGLPVIAHLTFSDATSSLMPMKVSMASNADPSAGDWTTHTVATVIPAAASSADAGLDIASNGGRLLLSFKDDVSNNLRMAVSSNGTPTSSADWAIHTVNAANTHAYHSLAIHNGMPAIAWRDAGTALSQNISIANTALPSAPANWTTHVIEDSASSLGFWSDLISYNSSAGPRLAIAYRDSSFVDTRFSRATVLTPSSTANWTTPYALDAALTTGSYISMVEFSDAGSPRLAVAAFDSSAATPGVLFWRSTVQDPAVAGDWTAFTRIVTMSSNASMANTILQGLDMTVAGGRFVIAYGHTTAAMAAGCPMNSDLRMCRANIALPSTAADWSLSTIDNLNGLSGFPACNGTNFLGQGARVLQSGTNTLIVSRDGNAWEGLPGLATLVHNTNCPLP